MIYPSCYYSYWYDDNIAFTNVVITNVHYPTLTIVPTSLNFGTVPVQQTAGPYYVDLTNPSTTSVITESNYTLSGLNPGDFVITRKPSSIAANGKDSIGVTYTPQAPVLALLRLHLARTLQASQRPLLRFLVRALRQLSRIARRICSEA